jgi:Asp-tRNA(Asn)/Glu-tRNA(Gln) amidotransferase A subunit family amidase
VSGLTRLPASLLREKIAAKKVSPVELTETVLARAEALRPVLNCFITLVPDVMVLESGTGVSFPRKPAGDDRCTRELPFRNQHPRGQSPAGRGVCAPGYDRCDT